MKKLSLLLFLFLNTLLIKAQIAINIEPGLSVSSQSFIFNNTAIGLSAFAGVEYADIKISREIKLNFSSNLGYIKKGGQFKSTTSGMFSNLGFSESSLNLNYISLNTTTNFNYKINKTLIPFIGIGPYMDMLMSYNNSPKQFFGTEKPSTFNIGALFCAGMKYIYEDFQFGINFNYFAGFNKTSSWLGKDIRSNSLSFGLLAGYCFK